jgi:hypothetical protein
MHSSARKVALIGAYDRFNYGDLLFPVVTSKCLTDSGTGAVPEAFSLRGADLRKFGAMLTSSLSRLNRSGGLSTGDVAIFNGGGTLAADWTYIFSNTVGHTAGRVLDIAERLLGRARMNDLVRTAFRSTSPLPFVGGHEDFPSGVKVAYNAVGGSEIVRLAPALQHAVAKRLEQADFLSVRDNKSAAIITGLRPGAELRVAPDSAVVMSTLYPVPALESASRAAVVSALTGDYLCFQCYRQYESRQEEALVRLIEGVYRRFGLPVLLLPIGRYAELGDDVGLRKLAKLIKTPVLPIFDDASIWEIMLSIARSKLFIGTSLHGNITSQSFGVRHLGLSEEVSKLDYYLETWESGPQSSCLAIDRLEPALEVIAATLRIPEADLQANRERLVALSQANFRDMFAACGLVAAAEPAIAT